MPHKMKRKCKVRTGCSVCKIRRVKCDETKPCCNKCTSTGRTCEGYTLPLPKNVKPRRSKYDILQVPQDRDGDVALDATNYAPVLIAGDRKYAWHVPQNLKRAWIEPYGDENRGLHYYRTRASKNISDYFDADFWDRLVLQVSEQESVVRHAVLALSALHDAREKSQLLRHPPSYSRYHHLKRAAICRYDTAIKTLLNAEKPHIEMILISCLIFTWIEFMLNNVSNALTHLQSGHRILLELHQQRTSRVVVNQVAHIFGRVLMQATLHRSLTVEIDYHAITGYNSELNNLRFETLTEARTDLDDKISSALHFFRGIGHPRFVELLHGRCTSSDLPCLKCDSQAHADRLDQWQRAFLDLRDRLDVGALEANALQALRKLELSYLLISNTLDTFCSTTLMTFDKYNRVYARMTYLCSQILEDLTLHSRLGFGFTLPFDTIVQRALFYVVLRCRDVLIRRRAVWLLQLCPDSESIWQRASLVAFCEWKIDIEEEGRPQGALESDPLPEDARVYSEKARKVIRDGQTLVVILFKRGASSGISEEIFGEGNVVNMAANLSELLRKNAIWTGASF